MPKTTIDFETRSRVQLPKRNVSVYARDPSTHALCLAYTVPGEKTPRQWHINLFGPMREPIDTQGCPGVILQAIEERWEFHAHNAAFEKYIWHWVCHKRYGWPDIPAELWHCTAGKAAHANMPRSLGKLTVRLGMGHDGKDADGKRLIKLLSMPQKMTKKRVKSGKTEWEDDPTEHAAFRAYNKQDVVAEDGADERLPDWPEVERQCWLMDRRINERGLPFDRALCEGALKLHAEIIARNNARMAELTGGAVTACTQVERLGNWILERADFPCTVNEKTNKVKATLGEPIILEWLNDNGKDPVNAPVVEALKLRLDSASATVKKYRAALDTADADDRIRETLLYYAAPTGRWGGRGMQPQNFKRVGCPSEFFIDLVKTGDFDLCNCLWDKSVMSLLKACIRGIIVAPPGRSMVVSDFSGIEARVLAWIAGSKKKCDLFARGQDPYITAACEIYQVPPEEIATWGVDPENPSTPEKWLIKKPHKEKRSVGKVAELGLGYGMGPDKYVAAAKVMGGVIITREFSQKVVTAWRENNPEITRLWSQVGKAAIFTVRTKQAVQLGALKFRYHSKNYLTIELPSGRNLYYFAPRIEKATKWGEDGIELQYKDGSKSAGGLYTKTYGGKLVENIVQAISRDLLVGAMRNIESRYPEIILHVHDEVVVEVDDAEADAAFDYVHACMTYVPPWAQGLPLGAETHTWKRYTK